MTVEKRSALNPGVCSVAGDHLDVRSGQSGAELGCQIFIHLDCRDAFGAFAKQVGCPAGARANFEHLLTEISDLLNPWQQFCLKRLCPLVAGEV